MFNANPFNKIISLSILVLILIISMIQFQNESFSKAVESRTLNSFSDTSEVKTISVVNPSFPLSPGINECSEDSICSDQANGWKERQANIILNHVLNNTNIRGLLSMSH